MRWPEPGMRRLPLFLAAALTAAIQTGVLAWMVESRADILRDGKEILLKTAPVDPRDLLRGDYVSLTYDISTIPRSRITGPIPSDGKPHRLYVRVVPGSDGAPWMLASASFEPVAAESGVVLQTEPVLIHPASGDSPIRVRYGIERFYVPEGEGAVLEHARGAKTLTVDVRVAESGKAQLRSVMIDGKPVFEEPFY